VKLKAGDVLIQRARTTLDEPLREARPHRRRLVDAKPLGIAKP